MALALALAGCAAAEAPAPADPVEAKAEEPATLATNRELALLLRRGPRTVSSGALRRTADELPRKVAGSGLAWSTFAPSPSLVVAALQSPAGRGAIVLATPLDTGADRSHLAEESSGAALLVGVARALGGERLPLALRFVWLGGERGEPAFGASRAAASIYGGAELVIYVNRACGLPERRDLLSHRVLRERFFRAASLPSEPASFEETPAPHAELRAAGAARVVALDAPAGQGGACSPIPLEDALVRFVRDAADLLARGGSSGEGGGGAPSESAAG